MSGVTIIASMEPDNTPQQKKGKLAVNLAANIFGYGLNIFIVLLFVPYLIRHLGISSYGLIPLTAQVTYYMSLMTVVVNETTGRYLTVALERRDLDRANRVFNTSLLGTVALTALCFPIGAWLVLHAEKILRVPQNLEVEARILLGLTIGGYLLNQLSSPFAVSTLCKSRFDLRNAIDISAILIRVGIVVLAFNLFVPSVMHVGIGLLLGGLTANLGSVAVWRLLTPEIKIRRGGFDWLVFSNLFATGGWIAINHLGTLFYIGIDLIVVNRLIGPDAGGQYAIVLLFSTLLRGASVMIAYAIYPNTLFHFAAGEIEQLITWMRTGIKMIGFALVLPVGLISGMATAILNVWVGGEYSHLNLLMILLTAHLSINLSVSPLLYLMLASNRVRIPALFTLGMGLANLALAILLTGPMRLGMYGVAIAGALMLSVKNLIFAPIYSAHILGAKKSAFYREILTVAAGTFSITVFCWFIANLAKPDSWSSLVILSAFLSIIYCLVVYRLILSRQEQKSLLELIAACMRRHN